MGNYNELEELEQQISSNLTNVSSQVGRATLKQAHKASKKVGRKVAKTTGKLLKRGVKAVGKLIVSGVKALINSLIALGPIGLIILAIIGVIFLIILLSYEIEYETKGTGQQYSQTFANTLVYDDEDFKINYHEENKYNKSIQYYYEYFSKRSYWKYINGALYSPDNYLDIVDYYGKEQNFLLKPELLYALDEQLFDGDIRYPEQLIRPVYFSVDQERQVPLRNDEKLFAISDKRDKDGSFKKEEVASVSDYGLGSVFTYHAAKRTLYIEGDYYKQDVYNHETGEIEQELLSEPIPFEAYELEGYPQDIYVMDSAITMAGTIKYHYQISSKVFSNLISGETDDPSKPYTKVLYRTEYVPYTYVDENGVEKQGTHAYKLYRYRTSDSYVYEELPVVAETQTDDTGSKYIYDYVQSFETYLPNTATNFNNLKMVELMDYMVSDLSFGDISPGSKVNSSNYNRALSYLKLFQKYAEIYCPPELQNTFIGVLVAITATESSGYHEQNVGAEVCSRKGCGLMQIEKPGIVITSETAYNYKTGQNDTMYINSYKDVANVEDNIRAGVMALATRMKSYNNNVFAAIQGYNFGSGAFGDALEITAKKQGISVQELLSHYDDVSWMEAVKLIHQSPLVYSPCIQKNHPNWSGTYGDGDYLYKVLSYYNGSLNTFAGGTSTSSSSTAVTQNTVEKDIKVINSQEHIDAMNRLNATDDDDDTLSDTSSESAAPTEMSESMNYAEMYVIPQNRIKKITYEFEDNDFGKVSPVKENAGWDSKGNKRRYLKVSKDSSSKNNISSKKLKKMDKQGIGIYKGEPERIRYMFKTDFSKLKYTLYVHHLSNAERVEEIFRIAKIMEEEIYYSDAIQEALGTSNMWEEGYLSSISTEGMDKEQVQTLVPDVNGYCPPLADPNFLNMITSPYGMRNGSMHRGNDFGYAKGTPIYAVYDGTVTKAGPDSKGIDKGGGLMIFIEHPNGTETRYMHMSKFAVSLGDKVTAGQCIGYVGNTGGVWSSSGGDGSHLHFELLVNGEYVDSISLFKNRTPKN